MTGEWGGSVGGVGTRRNGGGVPPPMLDPSTALRVSGPSLGMDSGSGTGMVGERGVGWCWGGRDGLAKRGPPPARPFDDAQGEWPLPGMDSGSETGMVGERGVGVVLGRA